MTVVLADRVFDGSHLRLGLQLIVLEGDRIEHVEPLGDATLPRVGDGDIDARGLLVMPGLVNAHVHIARGGGFEPDEPPLPLQAARNFAGALGAGTTTVGDLGCPAPLARALREHVRDNAAAGPDVVAAGPLLTAPAGYPFDWMPRWVARLGAAIACGDERDAARAVDRVAGSGMDLVKLAVMHQSYADRPLCAVDVPTASAVVRHAHRSGLRVLAHAHSNADYRVALAAGVDALMHSSFEPLDDELVALVRGSGVAVCPTLWVFESLCALDDQEPAWDRYTPHLGRSVTRSLRRFVDAYRASGDVVPPGIAGGLGKPRVVEAVRAAAANLRLLADAGVPIVFGNDAAYGLSLVARPVDELTAMHRAGLSVEACYRAATSEAARVLGLADRGKIAPGQRGDLVAVDGAAATDVSAIERVRWVIKRGQPVTPPSVAQSGLLVAAYARGIAGTLASALGRR